MKRAHEQLKDFHLAIGQPIGDVAKPDATVDMELRLRLIAEEFDELMEALDGGLQPPVAQAVDEWLRRRASASTISAPTAPDLVEVADALADLEYVTVGSAVTWGIPGHAVWEEVHASNLRKAGGPRHPVSGKALKPAGWTPPDIEGVLKRAAEGWQCCEACGRQTKRGCHCENDE